MRARYNRSCTTNTTLKYLCKNYPKGKDATMGNFEQTFENTYDDNGNLVSMKSTYNGDDGYFIDYIYAALNDASYNGEGTLLFDAATDTPSAA